MAGVGHLDALCIDAQDPHRLGQFWSELLGLAIEEEDDDTVMLSPFTNDGQNIVILKVPEAKSSKNRIHIDVFVDELEGATQKVLALGATEPEGDLAGPYRWKVFHDPEGNEFCLIAPRAEAT